MVRGTTPTFRLTIKKGNVDLTAADSVYVSIKQETGTYIEITGENLTVSETRVNCFLPQAQSLQLQVGKAKIQVNWTYTDANGVRQRDATKAKTIDIDEQLLMRAI